ncbi:MAG: hypothetical protein WCY84_04665 [Candidatus Cloacimonadaceae bacterium]
MIEIPASKSILQRLMVILAHARGEIWLESFNPCADVLELQSALEIFGFRVRAEGSARHFAFDQALFLKSRHCYFFEASATANRLWLSVLANLPGVKSEVRASEALFKRGIEPLLCALKELGAECETRNNTLCIRGAALKGGKLFVETSRSSQYASSLLLAAPFMTADLQLGFSGELVSAPYLKLSIALLKSMGARVAESAEGMVVAAGGLELPLRFRADSDLSTAAYYALKAALGKKVQELRVLYNPHFPQADAAIWEILQQMGAKIEFEGELLRVYPSKLHGICLDLKDTPDLMPVLCMAGVLGTSPMTLKGISRLRYKESDRVQGICRALQRLRVRYEYGEDALIVYPLEKPPPASTLDTQNDHRLVMAFSLVQMLYPQVRLNETQSLFKSIGFAALSK